MTPPAAGSSAATPGGSSPLAPSSSILRATVVTTTPNEDIIHLTPATWTSLIQTGAKRVPAPKGEAQRILVAFKIHTFAPYVSSTTATPPERALIVHAAQLTETAQSNGADVLIPRGFLERNTARGREWEDGGEMLCEVKPCGFVELSEVYLEAVERGDYEGVGEGGGSLQIHMQTKFTVLRQSSTLNVTLHGKQLSFHVILCLPVMQGTVSKDTRVVFLEPKPTVPPPAHVLDNAPSPLADRDLAHSVWQWAGGADRGYEITMAVLRAPVPPHITTPTPSGDVDLDAALWTSFDNLMTMGVLSGSSVSVSSEGRPARWAPIYGFEETSASRSPSKIKVYTSPLTLHNLRAGSGSTLTLRAPASSPPPPSVATEVTIARVAGRLINDKKLFPVCLAALKRWLEACERVVCEGDLVGVAVDEERARMQAYIVDIDEDGEEGPNSIWSTGAADTAVKEPAYFQISTIRIGADTDAAATADPATARIDPLTTRIVQSGILHSRLPIGQKSYINDGRPPIPRPPPPTATETFKNMQALVSACLHPVSHSLGLSCNILVHGPRGGGKRAMVRAVGEGVGVDVIEINAFDIMTETEAKTTAHLSAHFDKAVASAPCILLIRHIDALAKSRSESNEEPAITAVLEGLVKEAARAFKESGQAVIVVGTTAEMEGVPSGMQSVFQHLVGWESPSEAMRLHILSCLTERLNLTPDVDLSALAMQTAALVARDLEDVVARAAFSARLRAARCLEESPTLTEHDLVHAGIPLTLPDLTTSLDTVRSLHADSIGAPKIPTVTWSDVGGLAHVKDNIYDTIQLPLEHPELFASGMKKRSGILLYGPPGTGKTLVAKAVATNFSLNFLSVKGPELLNMYIGESEANVRRVFQKARDARPCVVFFDELDSVAPKRGEKGDSGGVMDRIVSQLLAEIDGMGSSGGDVFVIGATNRPDLLDPALLRPGRFDKLLYLGVSETHEDQLNILTALTRKFTLDPDLDLRNVAARCPFHYTGADFYALCSDAQLKAILRTIARVDERIRELNEKGPTPPHPHPITPMYYLENCVKEGETDVVVGEQDFVDALRELVPSVPAAELERYREVRRRFEGVGGKKGTENGHEEIGKGGKGKGKEKASEEDEQDEEAFWKRVRDAAGVGGNHTGVNNSSHNNNAFIQGLATHPRIDDVLPRANPSTTARSTPPPLRDADKTPTPRTSSSIPVAVASPAPARHVNGISRSPSPVKVVGEAGRDEDKGEISSWSPARTKRVSVEERPQEERTRSPSPVKRVPASSACPLPGRDAALGGPRSPSPVKGRVSDYSASSARSPSPVKRVSSSGASSLGRDAARSPSPSKPVFSSASSVGREAARSPSPVKRVSVSSPSSLAKNAAVEGTTRSPSPSKRRISTSSASSLERARSPSPVENLPVVVPAPVSVSSATGRSDETKAGDGRRDSPQHSELEAAPSPSAAKTTVSDATVGSGRRNKAGAEAGAEQQHSELEAGLQVPVKTVAKTTGGAAEPGKKKKKGKRRAS